MDVAITCIFLSAIVFNLLNVGDVVGGIIIGCIISLSDIAFVKPYV